MEPVVYVLAVDGTPLMPTRRYGKVRRMLKSGEAKAVRTKPFTIQLMRESAHYTQPVTLGVDPGRTNIGVAAESEGRCLGLFHVQTCNKDVPKHMADRREHRRASRQGERKRRKRRAKANGTEMAKFRMTGMGVRPVMAYSHVTHQLEFGRGRVARGAEKPVVDKGIRGTKARFSNRIRPTGWLTPTATHLLRTHANAIRGMAKFLPVTGIAIELNRFAFMAMDNPHIRKWQYQKGPLYKTGGLRAAVSEQQEGKCLMCGKAGIEHYHHVVLRAKRGSDAIGNIAGLCAACHAKVHADAEAAEKLEGKKSGMNKKYGALSVLNQIIPHLLENLDAMYPGHVTAVSGHDTYAYREAHGIPKEHEYDAYCIAMLGDGEKYIPVTEFPATQEVVQFRRHDRALVHYQHDRGYKLKMPDDPKGKKTLAKNRHKRTDQKADSLEEWFEKQVKAYGLAEAEAMRSRLRAVKSVRGYNDMGRTMPGAALLLGGRTYVKSACHGDSFHAYGHGVHDFPAKKCRTLAQNRGLVYV